MCRTWLQWGPWLRCPKLENPVHTHYYTLQHITALQSLSQVWLQELWITKCSLKLFYKTIQGMEVVYVCQSPLPQEAACGPGWRSSSSAVAVAVATAPIATTTFKQRGWRLLPNVLYQFLGAGLQRPMKWSVWHFLFHIITHNVILLLIIITNYYIIYFYIIITSFYTLLQCLILCIFTNSLQVHYYVLLQQYHVIITSLLCHYCQWKIM